MSKVYKSNTSNPGQSAKSHRIVNIILIFSICTLVLLSYFLFLKKDSWFQITHNDDDQIEQGEGLSFEDIEGVGINEGEKILNQRPLPIAAYKPMRKNGIPDLVVPNAHSSLILDVDSGTVLHYNNGRERRPIASLTKLMTAVVVVENEQDLDRVVTLGEEIWNIDGTKVGCPRSGYCISNRLYNGEKITIRNLLKATLMNSANDAATALAHHVGGSQETFVQMMNDKAKEIGLKDTNFCTPSGLEPDGREHECYSTAYDISRVAAYSMKHEEIWEIFRIQSPHTIYSADNTYSHEILNTDLLLGQVPQGLGGKTGFTPLAGHSLLFAAYDESLKHRVVAVVLNNPYRWQDVPKMLQWAFNSHNWQ